jgi:hypothetical protein
MLQRFTLGLWFAVLVCLLAGCGGGGGGGGGSAKFTAIADYTNFGTGLSGASTKWEFFNSSGVLLEIPELTFPSNVIDRTASIPETRVFNNIPKGTYHLRVSLYQGVQATGNLVGVVDEEIQFNGKLTYRVAIGTDPTSVRVTPPTATVVAGKTRQFFATARNSANVPTFVAPGSIDWSVLGGVLSVDEDGIVTGEAVGSGSVIGKHVPSGLQGGATVTVTSGSATNGKWTIMVFINAANDLYPFSDLNVNQMEEVAGNPDVRFVVQWKQSDGFWVNPNDPPTFTGTRRYLVKPDTTGNIASELVQDLGAGVDMGSPATMLEFLNWAKTNYPADRYAFVVWNHGNGWRRSPDSQPTRAVSYDDEFGTSIQTWQLAQALGSNQFDILSWDASLMQMIEVAYEVQDHADYVVGSEESPPGAGLPYDLVFGPFRDNPDATTLALSKNFVDGMLAAYGNSGKITQSVLDATQLPALANALSQLGTAMIADAVNMNEIDVENTYADVTWTTSGFTNIANAHDNNVGTSSTNPAPADTDHLTATFTERFIQEVKLTGTLGTNARIEYRLQGTWWPAVETFTGSGIFRVRQRVDAVRLAYQTGTGFSPTTSTVQEMRILVRPAVGAREQAQAYSSTAIRIYRDVFDLAEWIKELSPTAAIDNACNQVQSAVNAAVKWEGHNANSPDSRGIAVDFSSSSVFTGQAATDYANLRFANDTSWNEWLAIAP